MSGICGIVNFDGASVNRDVLQKMVEAAAHRGPDGIHYWLAANVGLAYLALHTTSESSRENQPLRNAAGNLVLTADARVDNREELIHTLTAKGHLKAKNPTDAQLIIASYECWGKACPEHIIGDFAFVVWDARRQRLVAARDRAGCRPFYYRSTPRCFQWATEAAQLLADPHFTTRLNEQMIARDLVLPGYGGRHDSYYVGVGKLGPAERLTVDKHQVKRERYWDFTPQREIRYTRDEEYAEHFREVFQQAVHARLRSVRPVGIFMSGGIDSTSIAATAADQLARPCGGLAPGLRVVHWTFGRTPKANEYEYSRLVADRWGFDYQEVAVDPFWPLYDYPRRRPHRDEPYSSHMYSFHTGCLETMTVPRPRVWMTGYPGDLLVGGYNPAYYSGLLRNGQVKSLIDEFTLHRRLYGIPFMRAAMEFFLWPMLLSPAKQGLRAILGRSRVRIPAWIGRDLTRRTNLLEWVREQPSAEWVDVRARSRTWPSLGKDWRCRVLKLHLTPRMRVWYDRFIAEFGGEVWNPWDDVRLAEFVLAIPEEQLARGINHKLVLRQAMKGFLPEAVREQRGLRRGPGLYIEEGIRKEASEAIDMLLPNSRAAARGFVDLSQLRQAIVQFRRGKRRWTFALWIALCLEMWLRAHTSD